MQEQTDVKGVYEIRIRILNTEIISVGLSTSNLSNRWVALGSLVLFCAVTLLGAYGNHLVDLYKYLMK